MSRSSTLIFSLIDKFYNIPKDVREQIKMYVSGHACHRCGIRASLKRDLVCLPCWNSMPFPRAQISFKAGSSSKSSGLCSDRSLIWKEMDLIKRCRANHSRPHHKYGHATQPWETNPHMYWDIMARKSAIPECPGCQSELADLKWFAPEESVYRDSYFSTFLRNWRLIPHLR